MLAHTYMMVFPCQIATACCFCLPVSGSGDYKTSWTIRNGGWPRYISTNIAGMYRNVFGIKNVKGLEVRATGSLCV